MQIGGVHNGCDVLCIRQCFQRLIPNIDRVLNGSFPIGVFINYRRQDLGEVVAVGVPDKGPQDLGAPVGLDAVLDVLAVEGEVRLGLDHPQEQVVPRQLGHYRFAQEDVVQDVDGVLRFRFDRLVGGEFVVVGVVA